MPVHRALFVAEGSSDLAFATHIAEIALERGVQLQVSAPDLRLLDPPVGLRVVDKLTRAFLLSSDYRLVLVHRDSDDHDHTPRVEEIRSAVEQICPHLPHVGVIPVRMAEAWLLVDEAAIRSVAGNPRGRTSLDLPKPKDVENKRRTRRSC